MKIRRLDAITVRAPCPQRAVSETGARFVRGVTVLLILAAALPALGQCNPDCQGDFNGDERVTIDEVLTSVNNALRGCGGGAQGCVDSGGEVTSGLCCTSTGDFPNTCTVGACGCSPSGSHTVALCECGAGKCFDGRACVARAQVGCQAAGGQIITGPCCSGAGNFPNTCTVGACGCAPQDSDTVTLCDCGQGKCFDGNTCVTR